MLAVFQINLAKVTDVSEIFLSYTPTLKFISFLEVIIHRVNLIYTLSVGKINLNGYTKGGSLLNI